MDKQKNTTELSVVFFVLSAYNLWEAIGVKKILISLMVSLFIMFVVPVIMVWLFEPKDNAFSTQPVTPAPVETSVPI